MNEFIVGTAINKPPSNLLYLDPKEVASVPKGTLSHKSLMDSVSVNLWLEGWVCVCFSVGFGSKPGLELNITVAVLC